MTGGTSANTFTVGGWTGSGSLTGGGGADVVAATKNADFTLTDGQLATSDGMSLGLVGIGTANLTGDAGDNTFTVSGWTGKGTLSGAPTGVTDPGIDTLVVENNALFNLSNTAITITTATATVKLTLAGLEAAQLTGGAGNNSFTLDGWTGSGSLTGGGGIDTVSVDKNADMVLTDASLAASDGLSVVLVGITRADLSGGTGNNILDASAFSGDATLDGDAGNDTLIGGSGNDQLIGDAGNDILVGNAGDDFLFGYAGRDLLIGGLGADDLDGGADDDIVIGESTDHDDDLVALDAIMAEWSQTSVPYATRIANLGSYLSPSTVHDDDEIDTLRGGRGLDWFFAAIPGGHPHRPEPGRRRNGRLSLMHDARHEGTNARHPKTKMGQTPILLFVASLIFSATNPRIGPSRFGKIDNPKSAGCTTPGGFGDFLPEGPPPPVAEALRNDERQNPTRWPSDCLRNPSRSETSRKSTLCRGFYWRIA